jgi:hypothetical protein
MNKNINNEQILGVRLMKAAIKVCMLSTKTDTEHGMFSAVPQRVIEELETVLYDINPNIKNYIKEERSSYDKFLHTDPPKKNNLKKLFDFFKF